MLRPPIIFTALFAALHLGSKLVPDPLGGRNGWGSCRTWW
jgi:hypothetical protein